MKVYKILMASLLVSAMSAPVWADNMGDQGSQPEMGNEADAPTGAPTGASDEAGKAGKKETHSKGKKPSKKHKKHGEEPSH